MPIIYEDGNYLTEKGRALIAKLMASKSEIEFTRAAVGSGTIPEGLAPKDMTDLAKWEAPGLISDISTPVPGEAQTVFQVFSRDVETGFLASEGAIWAKDPDEGEILYTYIVIANSPEVNLTEINPEAIATMGMMKNRFASFVELSEADTPAVDTRVHMKVLGHVEDWFEAPKEETEETE